MERSSSTISRRDTRPLPSILVPVRSGRSRRQPAQKCNGTLQVPPDRYQVERIGVGLEAPPRYWRIRSRTNGPWPLSMLSGQPPAGGVGGVPVLKKQLVSAQSSNFQAAQLML